jgi:hypothetical protein
MKRGLRTRSGRVCGGSPRAPEPRTVRGGIAQARLAHSPSSRGLKAAPSPRAAGVCANPVGFAVAHVTKARVARHENLPASRREHENPSASARTNQSQQLGIDESLRFCSNEWQASPARQAIIAKPTWRQMAVSSRHCNCQSRSREKRGRRISILAMPCMRSFPLVTCSFDKAAQAFSCNRPTGVQVFVSRSAFVTGMRGEPERLATRRCRRAKPQGFGCGGKDATPVGRNARRRADPVRGSGVWDVPQKRMRFEGQVAKQRRRRAQAPTQCPHQKRTTSFVEAVRHRFHSEYLLATAKRAEPLGGAL